MRFVQFSYYKTTNRTASCGVETALHHAVWLCHFAGNFGAICVVCAI